MKLGNLATRLLTSAVLAPLIILAINWERPEALWGLVYLVTLVSLHEFFTIMLEDKTDRMFGVLLGAALSALMYWYPPGIVIVVPAAVMLPALYYLFRFRELETVAQRMGLTSFGVVYCGLLTFISLIKRDYGHQGNEWIFIVLFTAWWGDTLAYFAGRAFGKKKLYPAISPGKTWAGSIGGLAGAILGAVVAKLWFFPELGWIHGIVVTAVGGFLGQTGDLVESMLKRARGVKDSGAILPGHGGMLDRIDAVIFIAPWVYLYVGLVA